MMVNRIKGIIGVSILLALVGVAFSGLIANSVAQTALTNGVATTGSLSASGASANYVIAVPSGQTSLVVVLDGPDGQDFDLYVKYNSAPTTSSYDARGYTSSADETCTISNPQAGNHYIMVRSYRGSGSFTIKATYSGGSSGNNTSGISYTTITLGTAVSGSFSAAGQTKYYKLTTTSTISLLTFKLTGPSSGADFDIYIKLNGDPSTSSYNWKADTSLASETINVSNAAVGAYCILVKAYSGSGSYSLLASGPSQPSDTTPPVISNINADKTATGATITWTTDENATTMVKYGISSTDQQATVSGMRTSHSVTITGLTPSTTYKYQIYSTDAAGNTATSTVRQFTTLADNTTTGPVQLTLGQWKSGSLASQGASLHYYVVVSSGATLTITLDRPDSGADFDLYVKKGSQASTSSYDSKATGSTADETVSISNPSGTYYIMVYSYSGTGNFQLKAEVATAPADTTPPQVSFTNPTSGATVSGTVTISISATDSSGIAAYEILIDGVSKATSQTYSWVTTSYSDGAHTLTAKAKDNNNNWGYANITVYVSNNQNPPSTGVQWTFIVWLAADNSLSSAGSDDLSEMKSGYKSTGTGKFEAIVMIDQSRSGDTKVYRITPGGATTISNSQVDSSWGTEIDSGSYSNLVKFVNWAIRNYPAQRYVLDLWNHGGGWQGTNWDDSSGSHITMSQLKSALNSIYTGAMNRNKIDVVGFDECLMGQVEVMSQVDDFAKYAVASEKTEPGDGWPYDTIFAAICANPSMTGAQMATMIAQKYIESYSYDSVTQAAYDLSKLPDLISAVDALAQAIISAGTGIKTNVKSAVSATEEYDSYKYYDLWHLCANLKTKVSVAAVQTAASNVQSAVENVVLYSNHKGSGTTNAHGITIYYGTSYSSSDYKSTDFCSQTKWDEMLQSFA
ncbi:MAG: clostripain-related cysteine peptidase [Thermoplasmata archaeon]